MPGRTSLSLAVSEERDAAAKPKPVELGPKAKVPLVDSDFFASVMGLVVVLNVLTIGIEAEFPESADTFGAVNNGFLLIYIIELLTRILTHGLKCLQDPFTVMDAILVLLSFLERALTSEGFAKALPTFRLIRLVRVLRASRMLRHSRELAAIAATSHKLFRTFLWLLPILFILLWTMAVFAHLVIGKSAEWNGTLNPNKKFPPFTPFDVREYFGTQYKSFITLLQVVTLSQWAPHIARQVVKVYPAVALFFVLFLFITTYGIMVCMVANIVQDSIVASKENEKAQAESKLEERRIIGLQAKAILEEVDADGSGELDEEELAHALKHTNLDDVLIHLGVPVLTAPELVCLLDRSGDGQISCEELVTGVVRMGEDISRRDYAMIGFWLKNLLMRTEFLEQRLSKLCEEVSFIRQRLAGSFGSLNHMIRTAKDSQMRQKAVQIIRTQGPARPPSLERKVFKPPTIEKQDPQVELLAFTGRFLGQAPEPRRPRAGSPGAAAANENAVRTTSLFRNTLGPAPPRMAVARRQAAAREVPWTDQYAMVQVRQNPKFGALKEIL